MLSIDATGAIKRISNNKLKQDEMKKEKAIPGLYSNHSLRSISPLPLEQRPPQSTLGDTNSASHDDSVNSMNSEDLVQRIRTVVGGGQILRSASFGRHEQSPADAARAGRAAQQHHPGPGYRNPAKVEQRVVVSEQPSDAHYFSRIPNLNRMILDKKELFNTTYEAELGKIIDKEVGRKLTPYLWPDSSEAIPDNLSLKIGHPQTHR
ncbi:MAG: hypothetical protein HC944_06655 [Nanoarchaeota archaeon]|nr:hypothetical protein [Nanoarchaeota archaeon]